MLANKGTKKYRTKCELPAFFGFIGNYNLLKIQLFYLYQVDKERIEWWNFLRYGQIKGVKVLYAQAEKKFSH